MPRASILGSDGYGEAIAKAQPDAVQVADREGQVTKLKLVKRQMYGRAKLDLLEARLIGAA